MKYEEPKFKIGDIVIVADDKHIEGWSIYRQMKIVEATCVYFGEKEDSIKTPEWRYKLATDSEIKSVNENEVINIRTWN